MNFMQRTSHHVVKRVKEDCSEVCRHDRERWIHVISRFKEEEILRIHTSMLLITMRLHTAVLRDRGNSFIVCRELNLSY